MIGVDQDMPMLLSFGHVMTVFGVAVRTTCVVCSELYYSCTENSGCSHYVRFTTRVLENAFKKILL
jgi:hypothetical protein